MIDANDIIEVRYVNNEGANYVELRFNNFNNKYDFSNLDMKKAEFKFGYKDENGQYTNKVITGYITDLAKDLKFPHIATAHILNRFRPISLVKLTTSEYVRTTSRELITRIWLEFFNLPSLDLVLDELDDFPIGLTLNKEGKLIPSLNLENASVLDLFKKVAEAGNCIMYWTFDGKLKFKKRNIPSFSAFQLNKNKWIDISISERNWNEINQVIVKGRYLEYDEYTCPSFLLFHLTDQLLDHVCSNNHLVSFVNKGVYKFTTSNYWIKRAEITNSRYDIQVFRERDETGNLWIYYINVALKDEYLNKYQSETEGVCARPNDWKFNIRLFGYPIRISEKFSRIYREKRDIDLITKYGTLIPLEIDNDFIYSEAMAEEIANTIFNLEKIKRKMVSITIPLLPLIELWDRITLEGIGDMLVLGIEHYFNASTSQATTTLSGGLIE